ncbi:MAG: hypothetical protein SFU85_05755 [Candidatus Methylacidiphilales bacterium]|nr:hypothetical protein [Candidatus Methylacidiphilales bacterium]
MLYHIWHRPRSFLARCRARGGFYPSWLEHRGEAAMRKAALHLPIITADPQTPLRTIWFLTGQRFWHLTLFCAWSLRRATSSRWRICLIDDGSLQPGRTELFHDHFEEVRVIGRTEALSRLEAELPRERYPFLHRQWHTYPNIRKLIDPHLAHVGWNLVLDSDMLFFRNPGLLLEWLDQPATPLHAVDHETSYGYPDQTLQEWAGCKVPPLVNVGLTGLDGSILDWDWLEAMCRDWITRHGTHYYLEQALIATLVARAGARTILPADDYVTLPVLPEAIERRAVLHHYVASSKKWYFRHSWQSLLA